MFVTPSLYPWAPQQRWASYPSAWRALQTKHTLNSSCSFPPGSSCSAGDTKMSFRTRFLSPACLLLPAGVQPASLLSSSPAGAPPATHLAGPDPCQSLLPQQESGHTQVIIRTSRPTRAGPPRVPSYSTPILCVLATGAPGLLPQASGRALHSARAARCPGGLPRPPHPLPVTLPIPSLLHLPSFAHVASQYATHYTYLSCSSAPKGRRLLTSAASALSTACALQEAHLCRVNECIGHLLCARQCGGHWRQTRPRR